MPNFRPNADELLANNERYVESFDDSTLGLAPRRKLAIVACMDSRWTSSRCSASTTATPTSSGTRAVW